MGRGENPLFNVAVVLNNDSRIAEYLYRIRSMADDGNKDSLDWLTTRLQELTEFVRTDSVEIRKSFESHTQELHAAKQTIHADMQQLKADMQGLLATKQELEANRQNPVKQKYRRIKQELRTIRNAEWGLWNSALETLSCRALPFEACSTTGRGPSKFKGGVPRGDRASLLRQEDTQIPRATSTTPSIFLANLKGIKSAFDYVSILLNDITKLSQPAKVEINSVEGPARAFLARGRYILREQLLSIFPDFGKEVKLQIDLHSIQNEETCCRESILPHSTLYGSRVSITLHEAGHLLGLSTFRVPHDDRPHTFVAYASRICDLLENDHEAIKALLKAYFDPNLEAIDKESIEDFLNADALYVSNARELMYELKRRYPADYPGFYPTNKVNLTLIAPERANEFIDRLVIEGTNGNFFDFAEIIEKGDDRDPFDMISFVKIKVQGLAQYLLGKFHNQSYEEQLKQGFSVVPTSSGVEIRSVVEPNSFVEHLIDSFGKPPAPNMEIVKGDSSDPDRFTLLPDGYAFFVKKMSLRFCKIGH
ncbi:MAG: hypothetical protein LBD17_00220 [Endomicrobium sp.]|nr:hypothetical protein [Endomicrobium sp.]